jgi:hypothetical protein
MAEAVAVDVVPPATTPETAPPLPPGSDKPRAPRPEPDSLTAMSAGIREDLLYALQPLRLPTSTLVWLGIAAGLLLTVLLATHLLGRHNTERKKQAVVDIFVKTMGSPIFGSAYSALYDVDASKVLTMSVAEFDKKIAQLSDIYWAVGVCVSAGQCDEHFARKAFCYDFKTYEFAYNVTHPPGQRWQGFDNENLSVFCGCEDKHRFSEMEDRPTPPPWKGCGRKLVLQQSTDHPSG